MTFCYIDPQTLFQILRMGELVSFCLCLPVPILNTVSTCVWAAIGHRCIK